MGFYNFQHPVAGPGRFYGRQMLLRSLVDGMHKGRNFALLGGPLTGRTSTLAQVIHTTHERWRRQPSNSKVVPVYVDLATVFDGGPRKFVTTWWQAIYDALSAPGVLPASGLPPQPQIDWRKSKNPWDDFIDGCQEWWSKLQGTSAWCEHALLLDNGDLILERALDECLEPIDHLLRTDADWAPQAVIAAGGRLLREHLFDERAPLSQLRPQFLGAFKTNDAEALIRAGFPDLDQDWVDGISQATGRNAFMLQRMLAELEARGEVGNIDTLIEATSEDCFQLFQLFWNEFDLGRGVTYRGAYAAPEHALMQLLIDLRQGVDVKTAERELGIRPLKEYAEFLEYLGVAERVMTGDKLMWRPHFELWNVWYNERILQ